MTDPDLTISSDQVPGGFPTVAPFLVLDDAAGFIDFACQVFGTTERTEVRTAMPDGRLIHAELRLGDAVVMMSDRLDGWPSQPGLVRLWVTDVAEVLERALPLGATVVTEPTPFYAETTLARLRDPWDNLWWLYAPAPGQPDPLPAWEGGSDLVFRTIDEAMRARAAR